jgi:uncharacterized BrkB/YihY/UPF0761 family membrane protein
MRPHGLALERWRSGARRLRHARSTTKCLMVRSAREHMEDHGPQLAAAISYYVLFSLFPLAILTVAVLGLVVRDSGLRDEFIGSIVDRLPLTESGQRDVQDLVTSVAGGQSGLGLLGVLGLLWTASGVMGTVRVALSVAWDTAPRPLLRGKLFDLAMVLCAGLLGLLSLGLTIAACVATGIPGSGPLLEVLAPIGLTALVFMLLYRFVPATRPGSPRSGRGSWSPPRPSRGRSGASPSTWRISVATTPSTGRSARSSRPRLRVHRRQPAHLRRQGGLGVAAARRPRPGWAASLREGG